MKVVYSKKQAIEAWFSSWSGKSLTNQQAAQLERPFSVEEIKQPVFSMAPDGFTMAFFQECWDMVQLDLVDFFHEFHMNGRYQEALMRPSLPLS